MTPEQIAHALEPLRVVDAKALDEIASSMRNSRSKQKRAVGAFLARINHYRLEKGERRSSKQTPSDVSTGLTDLPD